MKARSALFMVVALSLLPACTAAFKGPIAPERAALLKEARGFQQALKTADARTLGTYLWPGAFSFSGDQPGAAIIAGYQDEPDALASSHFCYVVLLFDEQEAAYFRPRLSPIAFSRGGDEVRPEILATLKGAPYAIVAPVMMVKPARQPNRSVATLWTLLKQTDKPKWQVFGFALVKHSGMWRAGCKYEPVR